MGTHFTFETFLVVEKVRKNGEKLSGLDG